MEKENSPNIKHIVISGGGTYGLTVYGVLRELHKKGFWELKNIESFYGTSIGTIISLIIMLGYEWETIDKFLIKRPWNQLFKTDLTQCLDLFENCGAFDVSLFHKALEPLFKGIDLELDITLGELYTKTGKDFYIYVSELNSFTCECISHKTHPEWKVVDAVYASSALPMIFQPLIKNDKAYIDGSLFLNYPLSKCIESEGIVQEEVLGIYKTLTNDELNKSVSDSSSMMDYFAVLIKNLITYTNDRSEVECKYQIGISDVPTTMESMIQFAESSTYREELINNGLKYTDDFLSTHIREDVFI
jgi:predicted patatin/cPLA2 family phospholipase